MNVSIKHNSTTITSRVISYERTHNICTGVGTLTIILEGTYSTSIAPHDSFSIYENGDFKVKYYVSNASHNIPEGTITVECQDKSKYLVDYFIPESYNIDYPSYTRTWIIEFLTQAGISYEFTTDSPGNLISNYTQLGLASAYDQVMMLCQMSGWYFYFDGNGKCIIGSLTTDLSSGGSIGKDDILDIKRITDDKMLRNRAVVWGEYDPYTQDYAFADVSVNTRWNYDRRDQRAIVISNSNIPNKSSAYGIANQLIKEFARPTIEKHIVIHGARNYNLGETLRVDSHVWRGRGLITTFGTSMSRDGLVTNVILDERCPRLFGFFNFGDYVYVATYGEGIWRKHIKFDPTWYNFSTGLTDLAITDLHINNGVFGSVGTSGEMYYANDEAGSWHPITITGLQSSRDDTASGILNLETFSGIYAHATIVDKSNNTVKFGVDTWSGLNMGDYFLQYSGWTTSMSGVSISGGHRGWIVEYDPYTGGLVGGLGSGIYPISVSGQYNITVLDLENDGYNDYVSVKEGSIGAIPQGLEGYALGHQNTAGHWNTHDSTAIVSSPIFPDGTELLSLPGGAIIPDVASIATIDDGITGERDLIYWDSFLNKLVRTRYSKDENNNLVSSNTSISFSHTSKICLRIYRVEQNVYRIFYLSGTTISYVEWNILANSLTSPSSIFTFSPPAGHLDGNSIENSWTISIGNKAYVLYSCFERHVLSGGINTHPQYFQLHLVTVNLDGLSGTSSQLYELATEHSPGLPASYYEYINGGSDHFASSSFGTGVGNYRRFDLFQNGDFDIKIIGWLEYGYDTNNTAGTDRWTELLFVGNSTDITATILNQDDTSRFDGSQFQGVSGSFLKSQLTKSQGLLFTSEFSTNLAWATNGETFVMYNGSPPYYLDDRRIYPMFGLTATKYIARDNSGNYFACDAFALSPSSQINPPIGYTLRCAFSNNLSFTDAVFWTIRNEDTFDIYLSQAPSVIAPPTGGFLTSLDSSTNRGNNVGGFFVHSPNWSSGSPIFDSDYIYFGAGDLPSARYLVLQRNGSDFTIIEEEGYPIRIDNSLTAPLLTVGSGDSSFHSNYITASDLTVIQPAGILNSLQVNDYRYSMLEPTISGIAQSGVALNNTGLFILGSGIYGFDTVTYSGGFTQMFDVPSGYGTRIETSNYGLNGQYIFITTSGDIQRFYQKDPDGFGVFTLYSGLVNSRATQIRVDDRF